MQKAVILTVGTKSLGLGGPCLYEEMHRVVEYTDMRWLHVDPHWIKDTFSGSRCLSIQSQVGLFQCLICHYQGPISMFRL